MTNTSKFFYIIPLLWGDLGVDIFFTLSGFLISFVLFKDIKKYGKIDYFNFIRSRFFRIWPAMFGYCVGNFISLLASGNRDWNFILLQVIPPNFFINNFMGMHQHLWSIAVEFQFYLISPFIVESFVKYERPYAWPVILGILSTVLNYELSWAFNPKILVDSSAYMDAVDPQMSNLYWE